MSRSSTDGKQIKGQTNTSAIVRYIDVPTEQL